MNIKKIISGIGRHSTLLALVGATIYLTKLSTDVTYQTALTIFSLEALNLWICYLVLFVLSPINYLTELTNALRGNLKNEPSTQTHALMVTAVFLSVHVFAGLAVFGVYFTKFMPNP